MSRIKVTPTNGISKAPYFVFNIAGDDVNQENQAISHAKKLSRLSDFDGRWYFEAEKI